MMDRVRRGRAFAHLVSRRAFLVCILALACRAERAAPTAASESAAEAKGLTAEGGETAPATPRCGDGPSWRFPAAARVVAVGDIHGDLPALRSVLRAAGLLDGEGRWSGGEAVLVQTGDILDRGDDERETLELLAALSQQAARAGGRVVQLNGNHELMNAGGDFRYVTPGGWQDFVGGGGRAAMFAPGGTWARRLARFPVIALVGDSLFAHGGVHQAHLSDGGLEELNRATSCWLEHGGSAPMQVVGGDLSPVWTRRYGGASPPCDELATVLAEVGAHRLIVGHTVQAEGVTSACDGRLWRIDVGMAAAYGGHPAALEISGDAIRVVPASGDDSK